MGLHARDFLPRVLYVYSLKYLIKLQQVPIFNTILNRISWNLQTIFRMMEFHEQFSNTRGQISQRIQSFQRFCSRRQQKKIIIFISSTSQWTLSAQYLPVNIYNLINIQFMMIDQAEFEVQPNNPFERMNSEVQDDEHQLFKEGNHQYDSTQVCTTQIFPKFLPPEAFLQCFDGAKRKKNMANDDTEMDLEEQEDIDIYGQHSSPRFQSSQPQEVSPAQVEETPLNMVNQQSIVSQPSCNLTQEFSETPSTEIKEQKEEKPSKAIKAKKGKKEQAPKVPKIKKIPSNLRQEKAQDTPNQSQSDKTKKITKKKKDERKNMYGYSFKFIVKAFLSAEYEAFLNMLCLKFGVEEDQVKKFYSQKLAWSISLKDLRSLLNYKEHQIGSQMRKIKQSFLQFYVMFMRKKYTLHILTEDKIIHKQPYLQAKNYLIYLPDIKIKEKHESLTHNYSQIDEQSN